MKKTTLIIGIGALTIALLAPMAFAQGRPGRGFGPPSDDDMERGPHPQLEGLELTEEQVAAIDELREQHLASVELIQAEIQAAHEEMVALAADESATVAQVEAVEDRILQARRQLMTERRYHRSQVYELLTPEQQEQVGNAWRLGLDRGGPRGGEGMGLGGRHGRGGHHGRMGRPGGRGPGAGAGWGRGPGAGAGCPECPCGSAE